MSDRAPHKAAANVNPQPPLPRVYSGSLASPTRNGREGVEELEQEVKEVLQMRVTISLQRQIPIGPRAAIWLGFSQ